MKSKIEEGRIRELDGQWLKVFLLLVFALILRKIAFSF
jgi:hypothetical protein